MQASNPSFVSSFIIVVIFNDTHLSSFQFYCSFFPFLLGAPEPRLPPAPLTLDTQNLLMSQRIKCAERDEQSEYLVFKWDQQGTRKHFMQANSVHENKNKDGMKTLFAEEKHGWSVCRRLVTCRLIFVYLWLCSPKGALSPTWLFM